MSQQGSRSSQEKSFHDKAVTDIAKVKFPFPNQQNQNWMTYLNEPNQTKGINMNGNTIYPDIVVVNTKEKTVAMIGEIESDSSVNQNEVDQWKEYSKAGTFFLYVPKGTESEANKLISKNSVTISGLRTYHYDGPNIVITKIQL